MSEIKTVYHIIPVDGPIETKEIYWPFDPGYERIKKLVAPFLVDQAATIEHVNVFHVGEYRDMFVDELGIQKSLKRNERATRIYRNNIMVHAPETVKNVEHLQHIVGVVILFDRKVWM